MCDLSAATERDVLLDVVTRNLSLLRNVSAVLDTYGGHEAHTLRQVVAEFEEVLPTPVADSLATDFVVNGTFRVSRERVSELLKSAFDGGGHCRFRVVGRHRPQPVDLCTNDTGVIVDLDYPLHDRGFLDLIEVTISEKVLRLDLEAIKRGLAVMAHICPRHFADFLNENEDAITGDAFLQCCLFGQVFCA